MSFWEQVFTVWRALLANKMRSLLTLMGVIMGVATIVLLSSLVGGGLQAIGHTVQAASGEDLIKVSVDPWNRKGEQDPPLDTKDMAAITRAAGLGHSTVLPQLEVRQDAHVGARTSRVWVVGTNEEAVRFYQLELASGRFISTFDRDATAKVAVVGRDAARQLGLHPDANGDMGYVTVGDSRFHVVGLLSGKPTLNVGGNMTWNAAVAIPDTTFVAWKGGRDVGTILVKANETARLEVKLPLLGHTVRAILLGRNHPAATLNVEGGGGKREGERGFLRALQLLLYAVALMCLTVGGINIMNIMLVTVTERTREIGLRLALGARQRDIRSQFLFEAAAISGLGGLVGVALGVGLGWAGSLALTHFLGFWPYTLDPAAVVVAFGSALGTGLLFGWYPAAKAASLQPIECLRYE
jgi:putative ABC transport system permease protein